MTPGLLCEWLYPCTMETISSTVVFDWNLHGVTSHRFVVLEKATFTMGII